MSSASSMSRLLLCFCCSIEDSISLDTVKDLRLLVRKSNSQIRILR